MEKKYLLTAQDVDQRIAQLIVLLCDHAEQTKSSATLANIAELRKSIILNPYLDLE